MDVSGDLSVQFSRTMKITMAQRTSSGFFTQNTSLPNSNYQAWTITKSSLARVSTHIRYSDTIGKNVDFFA